jgi:hypothetical protein
VNRERKRHESCNRSSRDSSREPIRHGWFSVIQSLELRLRLSFGDGVGDWVDAGNGVGVRVGERLDVNFVFSEWC